MALIPVGIHENLILSQETKINDKGALVLVIQSAEDSNAILTAFDTNASAVGYKSQMLFFFPNLVDFEKNIRSGVDIAEDLLVLRHKLSTYAKLYATSEEVEQALGGRKIFEGLGIPDDQMNTIIARLTGEEFMHSVVTKYYKRFIDFLTSKNAFNGQVKFRHKFVRATKDKNFAQIPNSTLDVWLEPMTIPKSQSKIAFSEWEIKNKKNDPTPGVADAPEDGGDAAAKAAALFNAGGTQSMPQPILGQPAMAPAPQVFETPATPATSIAVDAMAAKVAEVRARDEAKAAAVVQEPENTAPAPEQPVFTGMGN